MVVIEVLTYKILYGVACARVGMWSELLLVRYARALQLGYSRHQPRHLSLLPGIVPLFRTTEAELISSDSLIIIL